MKYKVIGNGNTTIYDDIEDAVHACIDEDYHWDDDYFENWLNDRYDYVEINGCRYYPYDILYNMDEDNLYDAKRDFCESENDNDFENGKYELRNAEIGDTVDVQYYTIEVIADEEDEEEEEEEFIEETGDYDGDEDLVEKLREKLKQTEVQKIEDEKNTEKDITQMLQVIGGK